MEVLEAENKEGGDESCPKRVAAGGDNILKAFECLAIFLDSVSVVGLCSVGECFVAFYFVCFIQGGECNCDLQNA